MQEPSRSIRDPLCFAAIHQSESIYMHSSTYMWHLVAIRYLGASCRILLQAWPVFFAMFCPFSGLQV